MASLIRAEHEQLAGVARQLGTEADSVRQMTRGLKTKMEVLRSGQWIGQGAKQFYSEMDGSVMPALGRLATALGGAQQITLKISVLMRKAEEDAARAFRGEGGDGSAGGAPGSAGAGDGSANGGGAGPGGGGAAPGGGASGPTGIGFIDSAIDNIAKTFKLKGKSTSGKGLEFGVDLFSGAVAKQEFLDGYGKLEGLGGVGGIGLKQVDGKWVVGAAIEGYLGRAKIEGTMVGDKDLGWTGGVDVKVVQGKVFAGYFDGSIGAEAGINLASIKAETGVNVAGANVGVSAEIGLKLELGLSVGKNTQVKVGPFSLGLSFGGAKK